MRSGYPFNNPTGRASWDGPIGCASAICGACVLFLILLSVFCSGGR